MSLFRKRADGLFEEYEVVERVIRIYSPVALMDKKLELEATVSDWDREQKRLLDVKKAELAAVDEVSRVSP